MYIFSDKLKAVLQELLTKLSEEDRKHFLFELKRNGDHLQVLITHYLNWKNLTGIIIFFVLLTD